MKKKWPKKTFITFIVLDTLAFIGLFLTYGPISYFRNLLVTTAMSTMNHKYLAHIFYSDKTIENVLSKNYIKEADEDTNADDIVFNNDTPLTYESVYEEQILKRDKNDLYKIIPLSGNGYKGNMVVIYDPSRVSLASSKYLGSQGQLLVDIAKENNAKVAINASGFVDKNEVGNGGDPTGVVIQDGKLLWNGHPNNWGGGIAGFNKDNVLVLTRKSASEAIADGMRDGVQFGPFLIVNGKASYISGNGGYGIAPRTVLAQRKDGIVLFIIIDGRQPGYSIGIDMVEMTKILLRYKAHNATNLDGGASSTLAIDGKLYNRPCGYGETGERWLPNAWIVK